MSCGIHIRGRVHGQASVHGLKVEVWPGTFDHERPLAETLTDARGEFRLGGELPEKLEANEVLIRIIDREGIVCRTMELNIGQERFRKLEIELSESDLKRHTMRPTSWTRTRDGFVSRQLRSDIGQALHRLAPRGSPRHRAMMGSILCPSPYLGLLDPLLEEAWNVLEGLPGAEPRFRDALATIRLVTRHGGHFGTAPSTLSWSWLSSDTGQRELAAMARNHRHNFAPAVANEHAIPLVFAARQAAGRDTIAFERSFDTIMELMSGMAPVRALHRAARGVILGEPGALPHFERTMNMFSMLCGPDDGPIHFPDWGYPPFDELLDPGCWRNIVAQLEGPIIWAWTITSVEPSRGCPGDEIAIRGFGFGDQPEPVYFGRLGIPNEWIETQSVSWTNEEILVGIPVDAGCGIKLGRPQRTLWVCGKALDMGTSGRTSDLFMGTSPEILNFAVNESIEPICVEPGENIHFSWRTCAADTVRLRLLPFGPNHSTTEGEGTFTMQAPGFGNTTVRLTARIEAVGICEPTEVAREITVWIHKRPELSVDGIEVTQAIQHYRAAAHLTDPTHQGPNNSLKLVAEKTALARVYLRSGQDPNFDAGVLPDITGTLHVERIIGGVPETIATLTPINTEQVDARANFDTFNGELFNSSYDAERRDFNASLNFLIPADMMTGKMRLTANVHVTDADSAPCGGGAAVGSVEVLVDRRQVLNFAVASIRYEGPEVDPPINPPLNGPGVVGFGNALGDTLAMLPVSETPNIRSLGTIAINFTLDGNRMGPGGCSAAWYQFLSFHLLPAMIADGIQPETVYYGMLPNALPATPGGCASFGVTASRANASTIAHETTHILGLSHTPCGDVGSFETTYPAYEPYDAANSPTARIGEYGFDNRVADRIISPDMPDFMSYCNPDWISIFTHKRLINPGTLTSNLLAAGAASGAEGFEGASPELMPRVSVIASVRNDSVEVHIARLTTRRHGTLPPATDVVFEMLNAKQQVLASSPLFSATPVAECGCGGNPGAVSEAKVEGDRPFVQLDGSFVGHALLRDSREVVMMRLRRQQRVLWERRAPASEPVVKLREIRVDGRQIQVVWESSTKVTTWIRWRRTNDHKGEEWRVIAVGIEGNTATLDVESLPSGTIQFQLLSHDGFYTAVTESNDFKIPVREASLVVVHPIEGQELSAGGLMRLWAFVTSSEGSQGDGRGIQWHVDGTPVGNGSSVWIRAPSPGRHTLEVAYADGTRRAVQRVAFSTIQLTRAKA